jgi:hypothetical protein
MFFAVDSINCPPARARSIFEFSSSMSVGIAANCSGHGFALQANVSMYWHRQRSKLSCCSGRCLSCRFCPSVLDCGVALNAAASANLSGGYFTSLAAFTGCFARYTRFSSHWL